MKTFIPFLESELFLASVPLAKPHESSLKTLATHPLVRRVDSGNEGKLQCPEESSQAFCLIPKSVSSTRLCKGISYFLHSKAFQVSSLHLEAVSSSKEWRGRGRQPLKMHYKASVLLSMYTFFREIKRALSRKPSLWSEDFGLWEKPEVSGKCHWWEICLQTLYLQ